jgi:DNA-binding protein H-NS
MTRSNARRKDPQPHYESSEPASLDEQPHVAALTPKRARTQIDLADYTFEGLRALHIEIVDALAARKQALVEAMRLEIAQSAASLGVSIEEVMGIGTQPKPRITRHARGPQAPKYRGPDGEEWSGHGPAPKWMKPFLAKGKTKADFLIKTQESA